jgi:DNA-binding transcriptional MocR family regulator
VSQSIGMQLDARRSEPLHRQIFDEVVARIASAAFPAGFKLPPTRVLALELGTHRNTVARAYAALEAAGFVSSSVGRGTFVEAQATAAPRKPSQLDSTLAAAGLQRQLPWNALLSRGASAGALSRAERHARRLDQKQLVNLARMQPGAELIPHELLRRCLARASSAPGLNAMLYAPPEGVLRLREQIAQDLVQRGVPVRTEEVLVTSGSQQGLDLIARALINPGDVVLVEETTYSGAIDLFRLAGAQLVAVSNDAEGPELAALERLVRPDVKALYLMPNAHNPTGRTVSAQRRRALIAWSRAAGVAIIEDDYAAGLVLDDGQTPPHLRALDGDVIHVSTFSKRLAPALRVGYVVAPAALRQVLTSMKRVVDLSGSLILQHAVAEFLERGYLRAHTQRVQREYRLRRDALIAALRRSLPASITWHVPSHGVVLWLRLPPGLDPQQLYELALQHGVQVSPSPMWSVASSAEPALRLAFCAEPVDRLVLGARRLGKAVKQLLERAPASPLAAPSDTLLDAV